MKKKLLFIMPSLASGGAEKSLVTLLSLFDYDKYQVDLLLFRREGLFAQQIPKEVNVLDSGTDYEVFDGSAKNAVIHFLSKGKLRSAVNRLRYSRIVSSDDEDRRNSEAWKYLSSVLPKVNGQYDAAIGYLEGTPIYYCIDCVNAKKRIGFLHTDYSRIAGQKHMDEPYFKKLDCLVGVSGKCCEIAENYFSFLKGKTLTIENIISRGIITRMSQSEAVYDKNDEIAVLTIGRLSPPKGIDNAVAACAILVRRGIRLKWYHIGRGELLDEIKAQIASESIGDSFILLGEKSNPYPYIAQCDIYVQPSRFEGKSIAVDEVKCLAKPIVVTNFPTVYDQITNEVNGIIVRTEPQAIADGVERLINDKSLAEKLCANLSEEKIGNEEEIEKLYGLIDK